MPIYAPPQRAPSPQVTTSEGMTRADALSGRATRSEDTARVHSNRNSRSQSLLQVRAALDSSPRVQSQLALQRALDQRAAAGGKAPAKKKPAREKPALQMKGIAFNDDAGLEREADVMGARARSTSALASAFAPTRAGGPADIIQRYTGLTEEQNAARKKLQGEIDAIKPEIKKFVKDLGTLDLKPENNSDDLAKLIAALERSVTKREDIAFIYAKAKNLTEEDEKKKLSHWKRQDQENECKWEAEARKKVLDSEQTDDEDTEQDAKPDIEQADAKPDTKNAAPRKTTSQKRKEARKRQEAKKKTGEGSGGAGGGGAGSKGADTGDAAKPLPQDTKSKK